MNNDVNEYKNAFNNNIDNNVTTRKRRHAPVINQFPETDTLGVSEKSKNIIPGYTKYNEVVHSSFRLESICVSYKYGKGHKTK